MKTIHARDRLTLGARTMTDEGYLRAPASTLARTGIQIYMAYELGLDGRQPMQQIRLYRPAEEVFAPASIASFEGKPMTLDHPPVAVTADNWKEHAVGDVRNVTRADDHMKGDLIVRERAAIDAINGGKVELSNGYAFELDMTPGTTPQGDAYDGVQRNIRGNHVAIVDAARCGSACRVADSQPQPGARKMTDALRSVVIDGIPLEVSATAAAVIERLTNERNEARKANTDKITFKVGDASVTYSGDQLVKLVADHAAAIKAKDAEIEELKKDVMTPEARDAMVADWSKMLVTAKRLAPAVATDGKTCVQIRREVVGTVIGKDAKAKAVAEAVLAGRALDSLDGDALRAVFNAVDAAVGTATAVEPGGQQQVQQQAQDAAAAAALAGVKQTQTGDAKPSSRASFHARLSKGTGA